MTSPLSRFAPGTDEYDCAHLYDALCTYSMTKDAQGLSDVLSDDYALIHMTGMEQPKQDYIDAVLDGTLNYYTTDHDAIDVEVSTDGQTAAICGRSRIEASVFGGSRRQWRLQQDLTARKIDDKWLLTRSQASTYSADDIAG